MKRLTAVALAIALSVVAGCVERTIKITSQPSGAVVLLNDEEVGRTPAEVSFKFYGDYGVILRKEGYETLQTNRKINAPLYQVPPFDIVADLLWPGTIRDHHEWHFEMQPQQLPEKQELLDRAEDFRREALGTDEAQPVADTQPAAAAAQGQ